MLEMRALGSWGGPSDVPSARARVAKKRKQKTAILTGESIVDRYGNARRSRTSEWWKRHDKIRNWKPIARPYSVCPNAATAAVDSRASERESRITATNYGT